MCSTTSERIAKIGAAIEELAADAQPGQQGQPDDLPGRLAELWAMIAELDPELAKRLPRYLA
jgi:hypothetical protein